jgi:hypothetical protein
MTAGKLVMPGERVPMVAHWLRALRILLVWLIGFIQAWIILFLGHEAWMVFAVNTLRLGEYTVPLVHMLYYCLMGFLMVLYFLLSMEYLHRSGREGRLLKSALLSIGAPLLLIALMQAGLTAYGFYPADRLGIFLMAAEGSAGAVMLFFAGRLKKGVPGGSSGKPI